MVIKKLETSNLYYSNNLIRFVILFYWSLYWLFNSIDKLIGGSQFLWVGKDRFALFQRFFASVGWGNPMVANIALIITAGFEVFAFLFFTGACIHLFQKKTGTARTWFTIGVSVTLALFTFFSIGDQFFGDHAELLEHTLYWIISLFTWVVFIHADKFIGIQKKIIPKTQVVVAIIIFITIAVVTNISIFTHKKNAFHERTEGVPAELAGENLYKFTFPFLAGSKSFENSLATFKQTYPGKKIKQVYTVPDELRKQKADGLIVYITTENKK